MSYNGKQRYGCNGGNRQRQNDIKQPLYRTRTVNACRFLQLRRQVPHKIHQQNNRRYRHQSGQNQRPYIPDQPVFHISHIFRHQSSSKQHGNHKKYRIKFSPLKFLFVFGQGIGSNKNNNQGKRHRNGQPQQRHAESSPEICISYNVFVGFQCKIYGK